MYIADNLKTLRLATGLSQEGFATELGTKRSSIANYETGRLLPPYEFVIAVSERFRLSIDALLKNDLSGLTEEQIRRLLQGEGEGRRQEAVRVLATTVGTDNEENIEYVPMRVQKGYCRGGFEDVGFIGQLPTFRLPLPVVSKNKKYRLFDSSGDSMPPIPEGAQILGEYVADFRDIRSGRTYILITREGCVCKVVRNELSKNGKLIASSLNPAYRPFEIRQEDLLEAWRYVMYMTTDLSAPTLETIMAEIRQMKQYLHENLPAS
ncbi:XRE family transcriptional regulator [Tellurirhabdus rosea]|uniref:XRE family transcriptional regulator n=1 Tax=Tellurirhabdus rosea TaxID=2674997 RepID=UPI0022593205|nr:helix-turn-helix domain-containing protein [Tellurirhabdus rosea]